MWKNRAPPLYKAELYSCNTKAADTVARQVQIKRKGRERAVSFATVFVPPTKPLQHKNKKKHQTTTKPILERSEASERRCRRCRSETSDPPKSSRMVSIGDSDAKGGKGGSGPPVVDLSDDSNSGSNSNSHNATANVSIGAGGKTSAGQSFCTT